MVFASMRAVRLFLRARAVIKFVLRAASTLENTDGEQLAFRKYSASRNLSLTEEMPSTLAHSSKTEQCAQSRLNQSQQLTANNALFDAKLRHVASVGTLGGRSRRSKLSNPKL